MNLHEYQAKTVLQRYGIPVPTGFVVSTLGDAQRLISEKNLKKAVVKVQVHAGGRGKAGGVKFGNTPEELLTLVKQMLGMHIVTKQTGIEGVVAHQLLLSVPVNIEKEYYVGAVIDRASAQAVLIISPDGGMEIEEIAAKTPDRILKVPIREDGTLKPYQLLRIALFMGWTGDLQKQGIAIVKALAKCFIETDASLLEVNPLVQTKEGQLLAVDAKLSIDENALYRQPELAKYQDLTQLPASEAEAKKYDLAYVALNGNIGCMVNGAGLAMATMDLIHHYGGHPANFLDVGGGASQEKVAEGFKIILSDAHVKAILINIFGGIMNCATLAGGIIAAAAELAIKVPLVVRMEGNNVENGKKMLFDSGLNIIVAKDLDEAAKKVVEAANR